MDDGVCDGHKTGLRGRSVHRSNWANLLKWPYFVRRSCPKVSCVYYEWGEESWVFRRSIMDNGIGICDCGNFGLIWISSSINFFYLDYVLKVNVANMQNFAFELLYFNI